MYVCIYASKRDLNDNRCVYTYPAECERTRLQRGGGARGGAEEEEEDQEEEQDQEQAQELSILL
jgi:hypothetical protein